ncbi:hypothetical protein ACFLR8_01405, partial [Bacteroidota bacterium]
MDFIILFPVSDTTFSVEIIDSLPAEVNKVSMSNAYIYLGGAKKWKKYSQGKNRIILGGDVVGFDSDD